MLKFFRNRLDKKGFTLVELLVVIAVLGIIAGIAIPRMSGVTDSFRIRADEETARNLARQVQIRVQSGITVPTAGGAVITLTNGGANSLGENFTETPQFTNFGTAGARHFHIVLTTDEIIVYNADTAVTTAVTTTPSNSRELFRMDHGGRIQ